MNENRWFSWALWLNSLDPGDESTTEAKLSRGGLDEIITLWAVPVPAFCIQVGKRKLESGEILVVSF